MKKVIKHAIGFVFMVLALYTLTSVVSLFPCSDTIKGAILLVSLAVGVVGEIIINVMRCRRHGNSNQDA